MSFIISLMVFISCVASVAAVHPISLGCYMFLLVSFSAGALSVSYSVFLGFCLYMVIVGGLLVVFAYAAALSPAANFKLNFGKVCPGALILFFLGSGMQLAQSEVPDAPSNISEFQYSLGVGFDWSWGVLIIFLAVVLFVIMVSVVNICITTGDGALVSHSSWIKPPIYQGYGLR
uniref:NADH dehydrogenase subunit 6 n=1 Tax=Tridacna gigas TaxID=80829 RepID=A0A7G8QBA4_TRIGG|nr:NADH dehydrogenase subunit 6 [Tridacna gigas]QNK04062.1 NADH dehydrogenase subunit 6 [Tridacna gigas]